MEKYLLIDYQLAPNPEGHLVLEEIRTFLFAPLQPHQGEVITYGQLKDTENFQRMIVAILRAVFDESLKFMNLCLVAPTVSFFTEILDTECYVRGLTVPFVFKNHLDLQLAFSKRHNRKAQSLEDMMSFYQQVHAVDRLSMMKKALLRLHQQGALAKREYENCYVPTVVDEFAFFKIIGWPFNIKANEVRDKITERQHRDKLQLFFINQNGRFTGNIYVSVPMTLRQEVMQKNKARVGSRYIEIKEVDEHEFDTAKLKYNLSLENIRKDFGSVPQFGRKIEEPIYQPRQIMTPRKRMEEDFYRSRHDRRRLKHSRRDSSESSSEYSNSRRKRQQSPSHSSQRPFPYFSRLNSYLPYGIRIRGLPFSYQNQDIFRLVQRYNPIPTRAKVGHKGGKKSGQAVVLFQTYKQAYRALQLQGLTIWGRYLQVILISEQDYERFK